MEVILVGEDQATREILRRLLSYTNKPFDISREEPVRGSQVINLLPSYNRLRLPVVALIDLDRDCPPVLIRRIFQNNRINENLFFRIAVEEVESWLMSDKSGFAHFLGIPEDRMPGTRYLDRRNHENIELDFPYKPSLYMSRVLIPLSRNLRLREQLTPVAGARKGPGYNTTIVPYIRGIWNINTAMMNSFSLRKAVQRLVEYNPILAD